MEKRQKALTMRQEILMIFVYQPFACFSLFFFFRKSPFLKWWPTVVDSFVISVESAVRTRKPCLTISAICWRTAVLVLVSERLGVCVYACVFA